MKPTILCCLLWLTCLTVPVQAQSTAVIEADSNHVETGNPCVLHLKMPGNTLPDTLDFDPWSAVVKPGNMLTQTAWIRSGNYLVSDLTVVFFDADTVQLPPLAITFSQRDTLFTNVLDLIIYPTPSPDELIDMAPVKDINREPVLWTDYLPWAAAILGVLAILGLLFWWYSRSKNRPARSRVIELLPHELALKKLDVLLQKAQWRHGDVKTHCAELTFILREYLEKRYYIPALETTSEEIMAHLMATDFPGEFKADLENILLQADLVKFAKAIPAEDFYIYTMDFARAMVTRTILPYSLTEGVADSTIPDTRS